MKTVKTIAVLVAVLGLGFWSWSKNSAPDKSKQPTTTVRTVDPQARVILDRANIATAAAKVLQYNASYEFANLKRKSSGRVRMDQPRHWIDITLTQTAGDSAEPKTFDLATDGETVFVTSHSAREFVHGMYPERASLLRIGSDLMMSEFGRETPFMEELNGTVRYEGSADVNGVKCDVVYVEYDRVGIHARWYFGEDGLPRKVERLSNMLDYLPKEQQFVEVLTLSDVELNPTLVVADFQHERPADYEDIELAPRPALLTAGTTAPDWQLSMPDGGRVSLASLRGSVVVMDFWATWCVPCKIAMPEVQKVHEHFRDQPVKVFGVNCMEGAGGDPAKYMRSQKFTYSLLLDGDGVADAYNVSGIPTFYVVDQQGRIAFSSVGAGSEEGLTVIIEKLLATDPTVQKESDS